MLIYLLINFFSQVNNKYYFTFRIKKRFLKDSKKNFLEDFKKLRISNFYHWTEIDILFFLVFFFIIIIISIDYQLNNEYNTRIILYHLHELIVPKHRARLVTRSRWPLEVRILASCRFRFYAIVDVIHRLFFFSPPATNCTDSSSL